MVSKLRRSLLAVTGIALLASASCNSSVSGTGDSGMATIRGSLSFPSEYIPTERVVAFDAGTMQPVASVDTHLNQRSYELTVPPGDYYIVVYATDPEFAGMDGGYTEEVPMGCTYGFDDHTLIKVTVSRGEVVEGIDPADWYAPTGTFPDMP